MTGFGRSRFDTPRGPVRVEIKSTNLKFLELSSRVPEELVPFSEAIRKMVQRRARRGKVLLSVTAPESLLVASELSVNERLALEYARALRRLGRLLRLNDEVALNQIARMPDVLSRSVSPREVRLLWRTLKSAIGRALESFDRSRRLEGQALTRDMRRRAERIARHVRAIRARAPKVIERYRRRVKSRLAGEPVDNGSPDRVAAETAAFAKNCDVTEELVRLSSHLAGFVATLAAEEEAGRKIDFIAQEMGREANTIGAKSNDFTVSARVIQIKAELERIREQAQNVE